MTDTRQRKGMKFQSVILRFLLVWLVIELPTRTETTGGNPIVNIPQLEYSSKYGTNVTLQCNVESSNSEVITVSWMFDDGYRTQVILVLPSDVESDKYKGGNISNPTLLIKNLLKKDEGFYKCSATNMFGTGESNFTRLFVKGNTPIANIPRLEYTGELKSYIIIGCLISSPDAALTSVSWTFDNGSTTQIVIIIPPNNNNGKYQGGNVSYPPLHIQNLTKSDEGRYKCSGTNMFGTGNSNSTRLTVKGYPPTVFVPQSNYKGDIRTNIVLACLILHSHSEVISLSWIFNNGNTSQIIITPSTGGDNDKYKGGNVSYPSLIIQNLTKMDEGYYKCSATNMFGTGLSSSTVLVVEGKPPIVQMDQTNYVGEVGTDILLQCYILSPDSEVISVSWIVNKTLSKSTVHSVFIKENNISYATSDTLLIQNLTKDHEGLYTCCAKNVFGFGYSNATFLHVKDLPVLSIGSKKYNSTYGQSVTLHCGIISSSPLSNVFWERNSSTEIITISSGLSGIEGSTIEHPALTILVTSYSDSGTYTCLAENSDGVGRSESFKLLVIGGVPHITVYSTSVYSDYGNSVTLHVTIDSAPEYFNVYWEKSVNGLVSVIKSGAVGTEGGDVDIPSLTIAYPTISDVGIYTINAINALGFGKSADINLKIRGDLPLVEVEASDYTAHFGQNATIKCQVKSYPNHTVVYWEKKVGNTIIKMTSTTKGISGSTVESPSITIEHVTTTDSGTYTCNAGNIVGTTSSRSVNLIVKAETPVAQVGSRNYTTLYGISIMLECIVHADPPVRHVFWKKSVNGLITTITPGTIGTQGSTPSNPSLTIIVPTNSDSGNYVCIAINDLGQRGSLSTELKVLGDLPVVSIGTRIHESDFGSSYTIECNVYAHPAHTTVYWQHNYNGIIRTITNDTLGVSGIFIDNPSLTINFITTSDSGKYTCIAENVVGKGKSQYVDLKVNGGPPVVDVASTSYSVKPGDDITMSCFVTSIPLHTNVYWVKNNSGGNVVLNHGTTGTVGMTVQNPSLTLKPAFQIDSGLYSCFALNVIGTGTSRTVSLKVTPSDTPNTDKSNIVSNSDVIIKVLAPVLSTMFAALGAALLKLFGIGKPSLVINIKSCTNKDNPSITRKGDTVELICTHKGFLDIKHCTWYLKNDSSSSQIKLIDEKKDGKRKATCLCLCCKRIKKNNYSHFNHAAYTHEKIENGFKLTITEVDKEQEGEYTCKASNILRENTSGTVDLKLKDDPVKETDVNIKIDGSCTKDAGS